MGKTAPSRNRSRLGLGLGLGAGALVVPALLMVPLSLVLSGLVLLLVPIGLLTTWSQPTATVDNTPPPLPQPPARKAKHRLTLG